MRVHTRYAVRRLSLAEEHYVGLKGAWSWVEEPHRAKLWTREFDALNIARRQRRAYPGVLFDVVPVIIDL